MAPPLTIIKLSAGIPFTVKSLAWRAPGPGGFRLTVKSVGGLKTVVPQFGLVTEQPPQVGVGDDVGVAVGVGDAVAVGVGVGYWPQYLPPVFARPESSIPPHTSISLLVHIAV